MQEDTQTESVRSQTASQNDEFSFGSGRVYAKNTEYASKNIRFDILAVEFEPGRGYEGEDRWAVTVKAADRGCEILTLGSNPGRDEDLRKAQAHLGRGGSITNRRLSLSDKAYYFTN